MSAPDCAQNAESSAVVPRLTREQAAIVSAYSGIAFGPLGDIQEYAERKLGRTLWTHEFASKDLWAELREAARDDLLAIARIDGDPPPVPLVADPKLVTLETLRELVRDRYVRYCTFGPRWCPLCAAIHLSDGKAADE